MSKMISRKIYDQVREAHRKGMKVSDISKKYNIPVNAVRMILSEEFENI